MTKYKMEEELRIGGRVMVEWNNGIAKLILPTPFPVGDVNVYVINGERLTLVDVGPNTNETWNALQIQLKELKLDYQDIEQVILTHHHPDHVGLLDRFPSSLEVYGHPHNERWVNPTNDFIQEHQQYFKQLFVEFAVDPDYFPAIEKLTHSLRFSCHRPLTGHFLEGDSPVGLHEWKVIETPGHAQSHVGFFREKDGVYISGDHLLAHVSPNPILEPPLLGKAEREKPQLQYNQSLKKMLQYPIDMVYNGHGEEVFQVDELVSIRLSRQYERAMLLKNWLKEKPYTIFELCKRLFPRAYKRELGLTLSETVAQIDFLESLGEIISTKTNGVHWYSANNRR